MDLDPSTIKQEVQRNVGRCCGKEAKSQKVEGLCDPKERNDGETTWVKGNGKSTGKHLWSHQKKRGEWRMLKDTVFDGSSCITAKILCLAGK